MLTVPAVYQACCIILVGNNWTPAEIISVCDNCSKSSTIWHVSDWVISPYMSSPPQQQNPLEVPMQIIFLFHLPRLIHAIICLVLKFVKFWITCWVIWKRLLPLRTLLINCNCVSVWSPPPVFSLCLWSWHSNKIKNKYIFIVCIGISMHTQNHFINLWLTYKTTKTSSFSLPHVQVISKL